MTLWNWLFDPSGLSPHGFCLVWEPGLISLYVVADALTALAYFSIPALLWRLARLRPTLRYSWVLYLFAAFILACGATHVFDIVTLWIPAYGAAGVAKLLTGLLSVTTAVALWPLIPRIAALPSTADLNRLNGELHARGEELRAANEALERRVAERTRELAAANARLETALGERTAALAQRNLLLRETYHRVKNNLQIVDGLLVLMSRQIEDPRVLASLADLRRRVYALGLVHQQLMASQDLETFDIDAFLVELAENLANTGPSPDVSLSVDARAVRVNLDFAIPVGLIVTELVTNSMKHAVAEGRVAIRVRLDQSGDGPVEIIVSDNGIAGGEFPARRGIGGNLVDGLIHQLGGEMKVSRDGGWRTKIVLPAPAIGARAIDIPSLDFPGLHAPEFAAP